MSVVPGASAPSIATISAPPFGLKVHAAGLDFGGAPLFEALDLALAAGSWTCLLGPSGVGKTSLLRLIAGLVAPWPGTTVECGDGGPLRGRIAYMAQQDLLLPWLPALDNVLFGARLRRERIDGTARERARWLLARVGLGEKLAALPAIDRHIDHIAVKEAVFPFARFPRRSPPNCCTARRCCTSRTIPGRRCAWRTGSM